MFSKCPKCKLKGCIITLKVHNHNIAAIKRYESLNFKILKENITNKNLNMNKNGILMVRYKKDKYI